MNEQLIKAGKQGISVVPANGTMAVVIFYGDMVFVPVVAWRIDEHLGAVPILPSAIASGIPDGAPVGIMSGDRVLYDGDVYKSVGDFWHGNRPKKSA